MDLSIGRVIRLWSAGSRCLGIAWADDRVYERTWDLVATALEQDLGVDCASYRSV